MIAVVQENAGGPSEKRVAFTTGLAFVAFGFEPSERHDLRQATGQAQFRRNDQIPAANQAADSQHGSFNNNFVEIEQAHNTAKNAPQQA
ncbi:hypothetical protein J2Y45_002584 [Dyadobacter sp. BE34]|uniref:Uncharacterized protein n=1 Tax=Dyadobacter fermentans TaxID=94254 RepID=A0ABU1QVC7_9BACT|nr:MULTISPECIES: hypothetical protein [Dyadobacter]MDR6805108.1 hypothetical protein [Dyadobacter fermentans]MDR7043133.1 hypothetical protein [Dyadobacter sp. BE242]MDR7197445.1 hypothetical protein [Dyadobacter sp. BE34]MDR7215122.1 hypothetical protein [Dyadobacter sp. BE31]MDR7262657.1 hypothetical protein [Dyadobacter sp. BE32]